MPSQPQRQSKAERQSLTSSSTHEKSTREEDASLLIEGLLGRHQEYFSDPDNRLDFMADQTGESFLRLASHVNARLRGEKPMVLRDDEDERGASLMLLHTPSNEDKPEAFLKGFSAIQEYLASTADEAEEKLEKVSMAAEALVIWVHPFNDGNGRTGRFLGEFVESGTGDTQKLIAAAVSSENRPTIYKRKFSTREGRLSVANNYETMLDDQEREDLRREAEGMLADVDAMYLSVKELINNPQWRSEANKHRAAQDQAA